jgi:DNA-binding response OmpR family regulator
MKPLRILGVEDDGMAALTLAEMLAMQGHDVLAIATTEFEAVAAALDLKPELMIVDAQLRRGSGLGAVDRIQKATKSLMSSSPSTRVLTPADVQLVDSAGCGAGCGSSPNILR